MWLQISPRVWPLTSMLLLAHAHETTVHTKLSRFSERGMQGLHLGFDRGLISRRLECTQLDWAKTSNHSEWRLRDAIKVLTYHRKILLEFMPITLAVV